MDKISELPDELLIKILLFLPTKVAVSTSLLSKRWEFLWMWLPRLEYNSRCCSNSEIKMLRCFLDRNLPLHKAPVIERLCLKLNNSVVRPEDVKLWVVIVVSRTLRELKISYHYNPQRLNILPSNLYSCTSLVILKLKGNILLDVPRSVCLVSLKTLHLKDVTYFHDRSFRQLLSICPVLKHLLVNRCKDDNMGDFSVIVRSLESLSIYIRYDLHVDNCAIDTPSLKLFELKDYNWSSNYSMIGNMPKLSEANVTVFWPDMASLIRSITSVKRLIIYYPEAMYNDGFVFNKLEYLKLIGRSKNTSNLFVRLLKVSPNLRVLDLDTVYDCGNSFVLWNQPSSVPESLLSSLQTFVWRGYKGTTEERDVVVYILNNARQLKTTTIVSNDWKVPKLQMIQELALSSRASTMCQLAFR